MYYGRIGALIKFPHVVATLTSDLAAGLFYLGVSGDLGWGLVLATLSRAAHAAPTRAHEGLLLRARDSRGARDT